MSLSTQSDKSLNEKFRKMLISFYPIDPEFIDILLIPADQPEEPSSSALDMKLKSWFEKNNNPENTKDPFNKLYGIKESSYQNLSSLSSNLSSKSELNLNKPTSDLFYTITKDYLLKKNYPNLKSKLNETLKLYNINQVNFISNKESNALCPYPINFYSFGIMMRVLYEYYYKNILTFQIGIFPQLFTSDFIYFYKDLFCCYLLFIYYFSLAKRKDKFLSLVFSSDIDIYENYTYHIDTFDNVYKKIFAQLNLDNLNIHKDMNILTLINEYFYLNEIKYLEVKVLYKITQNTDDVIDKIYDFLVMQKAIKNLYIYADKFFFDKFNVLDEYIKYENLNINLLSLVKSNKIEFGFDKKYKKVARNNFNSFTIEGDNLLIKDIPDCFRKLYKFEYINKSDIPLNGFNISSFQFFQLNNLTHLKINSIGFFQFQKFFILNDTYLPNLKELDIKIFNEIDEDADQAMQKNNNKIAMLKIFDNFIDTHLQIEILNIKINNIYNPNYFYLSKENGYYFIDKVLNTLKNCYNFCMTNLVNSKDNINKIEFNEKVGKKKYYNLAQMEGTHVIENEHQLVVSYSEDNNEDEKKIVKKEKNKENEEEEEGEEGEEEEEGVKHHIYNTDTFYTLLIVILKKYTKLKPKPILMNLFKMLCTIRGKNYCVCEYNN